MLTAAMRRWRAEIGIGCLLVCGAAIASGTAAAEEPPQGGPALPSQDDDPTLGLVGLSRGVNGELTDVAGALRGLDQSYTFRGMRGCGSATAGSVFIDWDAKGIPPEQRVRVAPPPPLVLSRSCKTVAAAPAPETAPQPQPVPQAQPAPAPQPAPDLPCPPQPAAAAPAALPAPCASCGGVPAMTPGFAPSAVAAPCPCGQPAASLPQGLAVRAVILEDGSRHDVGTVFPAPVYTRGGMVYGGGRSGSGCCGGRTPPGARMVGGQWIEAGSEPSYGGYDSHGGYAQPTGFYVHPQAIPADRYYGR